MEFLRKTKHTKMLRATFFIHVNMIPSSLSSYQGQHKY